VIRFSCKNCGHKIKVEDKHSGRRGKCPKCGRVVVVPDKPTTVEFLCENCGRKISVPDIYAGRSGKCPKCRSMVIIPKIQGVGPVSIEAEQGFSETAPKAFSPDSRFSGLLQEKITDTQPSSQQPTPDTILEETQRLREAMRIGSVEPEAIPERKLPWIIDIFLYPTSVPCLMVIGVIILIPLLINILAGLLGPFGFFVSIPGFFVKIVIMLYMYWYFAECIRDSASGGLRAPETVGSMASLGEMFFQFLRLVACYACFFGPVTFYSGHSAFSDVEMSSVVFWSLLTYGVFSFPMGILAVVMFDSVKGLNPILLIPSIISTFLQYCGLFILFYGLVVLFIIGVVGLIVASIVGGLVLSAFLTFVFIIIGFIWLLFVMGHLLGRFYWKYQERLNWEV
jgi:DNA-directed RNA polymerase subunit RPC12/RpoP